MKRIYILTYLWLITTGYISGQATYKWFSSIAASQNSNYFIYKSSHNQVFISSLDGLNIYDGQETKTYRPLTHHMYGHTMSSTFFEDTSCMVWFTTSEALHVYNPVTDILDFIQMISSDGKVVTTNHAVFYLSGNLLYLRGDDEVFSYDVVNRCVSEVYQIDFSPFSFFTLIEERDKKIFFGAGNDGYAACVLEQNQKVNWLYKANNNTSAACATESKHIWLGCSDGKLLQIDPQTGNILFQGQVAETRINGIMAISNDKLLLSVSHNQLVEFDVYSQKEVDTYTPQLVGKKESVNHLLIPYLDKDSTLWVGGASQGVFFCNLKKQKFQHFLNTGSDQKQIIVTRILPVLVNNFLVFTRRYGILLINEKGDILHHWTQLPDGIIDFTSICATKVNERELLFNHNHELYLLDLQQQKIEKLQADSSCPPLDFEQIETLRSGKIIASCGEDLLIEIQLNNGKYFCKPYGQLKAYSERTSFFKSDLFGNLYISNNDTAIIVLAPTQDGNDHRFSYMLPMKGGITSLVERQDKSGMYFTNSQGLFYVPTGTRNITQITGRENLLAQNIYAAIEDTAGNLWLSTNEGILKYSPADESVKVYSRMDGVQAEEFNSNAYLKTPDGHIFFGGINGLNYFHPSEVISSTKEAPVYIRAVKINDEIDTAFLVPQFQDTYILPYARNTLSFDFHAIDYADPDATRTKYKLVGVDDDYLLSQTAKGFARYANLRYGHYTLLILGANSDGHWNRSPRVIEIIINPPFYLSWWFILFCVILVIGIIYGSIRLYYQRKLERKNQIVREQALIIEKQKAVEHERNRIASEMHDDLGSGLTTIRYLSDRALKQTKSVEEASQIKRISEHSNMLVRNMSEIIWAMNSRFDTAENLVGYLRRYASEYLEEHHLPLRFVSMADHLDKVTMGGEKRRNVFLVFKEMLHNAVKYSEATSLEIEISTTQQLRIHIAEIGGKGFDPLLASAQGNGLFNCRKRMDIVGGELTFEKTAEAMHIYIVVPFKSKTGE